MTLLCEKDVPRKGTPPLDLVCGTPTHAFNSDISPRQVQAQQSNTLFPLQRAVFTVQSARSPGLTGEQRHAEHIQSICTPITTA